MMQELFPNARIVHCQFHLAQILIKHIQKAGLMDVYCNAEVRPLLRSLWALAFLPPEDVAVAYEGPMVSLNAMIARDVIPQADVQHLNGRARSLDTTESFLEFTRDYFEKKTTFVFSTPAVFSSTRCFRLPRGMSTSQCLKTVRAPTTVRRAGTGRSTSDSSAAR